MEGAAVIVVSLGLPQSLTAPASIEQAAHLQLLLVKVLEPLKWDHLVEAVQESFGLALHAAGEPPFCHQAAGPTAQIVNNEKRAQ